MSMEGRTEQGRQSITPKLQRLMLVLGIPGTLLITMGLIGYVVPDAANLHPLLGNRQLVLGALFIGGSLFLLEAILLLRMVLGARSR